MLKEKSLKLREGRKGVIRPGHPWIFKGQLLKADSSIRPGDIIKVVDQHNKFLGRGYYNPKCDLAVRLLTSIDEPVDEKLFHKRLSEAIEKRKALTGVTNAYRAVFSEADMLPGIIIDIYADTAVFQALTLGIDKFKSTIADKIDDILKPKYIYEKSVSPFRKIEGLKDVAGWWGDEGNSSVEIFEGRSKFLVDITGGHKTGFYLDQRRSRLALEGISKGKKVLDLFCYTGGFSINAAIYGAAYVKGIDIKEEWLKAARANAVLNGLGSGIEFEKADAFGTLKNICSSGEKFDIIILDPPSFLKTRESVASAAKGYKELNTLAMKALSAGGILATFSCSHNMPNHLFSKILKDSADAASRKLEILKRCHQAADHPIVRAIPETEYLKGYFLKIA